MAIEVSNEDLAKHLKELQKNLDDVVTHFIISISGIKDHKKVAKKFSEIEDKGLPNFVVKNEYLNKFADVMMNLSNRLNEIEKDDPFRDDLDIKEDYLPAIREFINNITGL